MNLSHSYCSDALSSGHGAKSPRPATKSPPPYFASRMIYNNDGFQDMPDEASSGQSFSSSSDSNPSGDSPFDTKKNSMNFEPASYSAPSPGPNQMVQFSLQLGPAAPSALLLSNPTVFTFGPLPPSSAKSPPYTPLENPSSHQSSLRQSQASRLQNYQNPPPENAKDVPPTFEKAVLTEPSPASRRRLASSRGEDDPAERRDSPQHRAFAEADPDIPPPETVCIEAQNTARKVKDSLLRLCESGAHYFSREDRANFQFLADTVTLLVQYLDAQSPSIRATATHRHLTRALLRALDETLEKLQRLLRHESALTDTFEIFELTLRRYLEQFKKMFPLGQAPVPPLQLIEDPAARAVWERCCGATKSYVRFEQFERDVIEPEFGKAAASVSASAESAHGSRQQVLVFLRYLVNFPADDLVTAYKWNVLTRLFGPYEQFVENFSRICLGKGFLGLINRIKASEILSVHGRDTVLIRFSRTEPEYLAFSYHDANGVGHLINCDKQRRIIPLETFMRQKFSGFRLVDQYLNVRAIVKSSLGAYSDTPTSGYLQSHV